MEKDAINSKLAGNSGDQFHEAWVVRSALKLLNPNTRLRKIAVEGPDHQVEDQDHDLHQIIDAAYYYQNPDESIADEAIEYIQYRYSIARADKNFNFSDAKDIIEKFADLERESISTPNNKHELAKVSYVIFTNRPISPELDLILNFFREGNQNASVEIKQKADELKKIINLADSQLADFANRVNFKGNMGSLEEIEGENKRIITNWSLGDGGLVDTRLGKLNSLVRERTRYNKDFQNSISRPDVLLTMGVEDEHTLLPATSRIRGTNKHVKREQLSGLLNQLASDHRWVIHATGGMGKTQFALDLATELKKTDKVILFDCYADGLCNSDDRHLSQKGLMHIVNELSVQGWCEPILPNYRDDSTIVEYSLTRFKTAIQAIREQQPDARLIIIIDAADIAANVAKDSHTKPFPKLLLEYLSFEDKTIDGLCCIFTTRTDGIEEALGNSKYSKFELKKFSDTESRDFINKFVPTVDVVNIDTMLQSTESNPYRLRLYLETWSLGWIDHNIKVSSDLSDPFKMLIKNSVLKAKKMTGYAKIVEKFLRTLSILPLPIPIEMITYALDIKAHSLDNIIADLAPLFENFQNHLIFKHELVGSQIRELYQASKTFNSRDN